MNRAVRSATKAVSPFGVVPLQLRKRAHSLSDLTNSPFNRLPRYRSKFLSVNGSHTDTYSLAPKQQSLIKSSVNNPPEKKTFPLRSPPYQRQCLNRRWGPYRLGSSQRRNAGNAYLIRYPSLPLSRHKLPMRLGEPPRMRAWTRMME